MPPQPIAWPFPAPPQGWPNPSWGPHPNINAATTAGNDNEDGEESDNESAAGSDEIRLLTEQVQGITGF